MNQDDEKKLTNQKLEVENPEQPSPNQESEEVATIAPTLIKEDDKKEKKLDLTSIIPEYNEDLNDNQVELTSKEKMLKSDGAVLLATIRNNNIEIEKDLKMPEQIDMEKRKKEQKKGKVPEKVNKKKKISLSKKQQNIMSLVSLLIIGLLVGFYFYYKNAPSDSKFKALNITIEIGESLPVSKSSYIKPGIGDSIDELAYTIDTSNVIIDKVGDYPYTVNHNGVRKSATISIVDITPPSLEVREVIIKEGESYTPETFIAACHDWSGCNYGFEDNTTTNKYTSPGTYVIYVTATDAYNNKTVKQASLVIEAEGMVKYFSKENAYDFENGYLLIEEYELHFYDFMNNAILRNGIYTRTYKYQDEVKYAEYRKVHYGEINYTFDDDNLIVKIIEKSNTVGPYYTRLDVINNYLLENNFIEGT